MHRKKLRNSDDALVGIVVTFLLIGLIVAVISIIQTVYIPKWMQQTESEHMEEVTDQFAQLKFAIDTQAAIRLEHTPISTSITLGSKELPFLMSSRAFGSLDILPDTSRVIIKNRLDSTEYNRSMGTIKYESSNNYFLNQNYIYETGGIILNQYQGNIMSIKPSFSVAITENVTISFTITNISKIGNKGSISGYGTYPIQTEYSSRSDVNFTVINKVSNITIFTQYINAWCGFINGTLINQGLNNNGDTYGKDYTIDASKTDRIIVEFKPLNTVNLNIKYIEIEAQVAPGWIENTKG
jgi:hypothetical protein